MDQSNLLASKLYIKTQEYEKQLRVLLKKKNIFDKSVANVRNNIRDAYSELLFLDFDYACSKDVEQNLWKIVFYKVIEEYRKQIRKLTSLIQKNERPSIQEDLNKMCESFRIFLTQASNFYHDLIMKFQSTYNLKLDGSIAYHLNDCEKNVNIHKAYLSCHRCYIFLGDLARYHRDLYRCEDSDWSCASIYYEKAISLVPDSGNPHNQLAVLATYIEDDLDAVYHYFRGLAVAHPFLTARENLVVLFEKNRVKVQNIFNEKGSYGMEGISKEIDRLERFKILFARLHGMLFMKTNLDTFEAIQSSAFGQFTYLLRHRSVDWQLLFKLFVISIVSLDSLMTLTSDNASESSSQSTLLKYAISLSLELFSRTLSTINLPPDSYGSIALFVDYLGLHPNCITKPNDAKDLKIWQLTAKHLANFLNTTTVDNQEVFENSALDNFSAISEERDLYGFVPLQEAYKDVDFSKIEEDERSRIKSLKKITKFAINVASNIQLLGANILLYYDEKIHLFSDKPIKPNQPYISRDKARYLPKHGIMEESKRESINTDFTNNNQIPKKESPVKQILQNGHFGDYKESEMKPMEFDENMDEEIILFKPNNKAAAKEHNVIAAIGSGRTETKFTEQEKVDIFEGKYNSFDLFKNSTYSNLSLFPNNLNEAKSSVQSNSFFSNLEPIQVTDNMKHTFDSENSKPLVDDMQINSLEFGNGVTKRHWSPMLSTISHSFFSQVPTNSSMGYDPWNGSGFKNNKSAGVNSYPLSTNYLPEYNPFGNYPFQNPSLTHQQFKTRNPFIS